MESNGSDINLHEIPVGALKPVTRGKLSCMLNRTKVLMSPNKFPRDYRGLGDLMGIEILSNWFPENDYVQKLLILWVRDKPEEANLGTLHKFFGLIDRYDVLDDTFDMFVKDAREYQYRKCNIIDSFIPQLPALIKECLTIDDVERAKIGQEFQIYDAFVLFVDADREFANKLIKIMESEPYNLRLCEKDRDLIGGIEIERSAIIKLIRERCRKLLVILSDEFEQSDLQASFVQFAQSLTYYEQQILSKVIPCMYKDCRLPVFLKGYFVLDYRRSDIVNFWKKLHYSVMLTTKENKDDSRSVLNCGKVPAIVDTPYHAVPDASNASHADSVEIYEKLPTKTAHLIAPVNGVKKKTFPDQSMPTNSFKNLFPKQISKFFKSKKKKKHDKAIA